jgi:hypothetical protein
MDRMTTTMRASTQTLTRIQNLARLYRSGYHSSTVDTTIDKLLTMEGARAQRELLDLEERLAVFERQYQLSSDEFYRRFRAGERGDSADMFEWSAFYQMRTSVRKRLDTLRDEAA